MGVDSDRKASSFPLSKLPVEVRCKIYQYSLVRPKLHITSDRVFDLMNEASNASDVLRRRLVEYPDSENGEKRDDTMLTYTLGRNICPDTVTSVLNTMHDSHAERAFSAAIQQEVCDRPEVAILRVNKMVNNEATKVLYAENCFSFGPQAHRSRGDDTKPLQGISDSVSTAIAFLGHRSPKIRHLIHHLEIGAGANDLVPLLSHDPSWNPHWFDFMKFISREMSVKHLSLVACGEPMDLTAMPIPDGNDYSEYNNGDKDSDIDDDNDAAPQETDPVYELWTRQARAVMFKTRNADTNGFDPQETLPPLSIPRLSVTLIWDMIDECPRVRKGRKHDMRCFRPHWDLPRNGKCAIATLTALSTLMVRCLRKALLADISERNPTARFYEVLPVDHFGTANIRGRIFRDGRWAKGRDDDDDDLYDDVDDEDWLQALEDGRHDVRLVLETDDDSDYAKSRLEKVPDYLPLMEPSRSWKTLADDYDHGEDEHEPKERADEWEMSSVRETRDAFEAFGGSERTAYDRGFWHLLF